MASRTRSLDEHHVGEAYLADRLLSMSAEAGSKVVDSFASWLLAGSGAAIAIIVSNIADVSNYITPRAILVALEVYFAAAALTIIEKGLAASVAAASAALRGAKALLDEDGRAEALNPEVIIKRMHDAHLQPFRWFVKRAYQNRGEDSFTAGRLILRRAQAQTLIALGAAFLILFSLGVLAGALSASIERTVPHASDSSK